MSLYWTVLRIHVYQHGRLMINPFKGISVPHATPRQGPARQVGRTTKMLVFLWSFSIQSRNDERLHGLTTPRFRMKTPTYAAVITLCSLGAHVQVQLHPMSRAFEAILCRKVQQGRWWPCVFWRCHGVSLYFSPTLTIRGIRIANKDDVGYPPI